MQSELAHPLGSLVSDHTTFHTAHRFFSNWPVLLQTAAAVTLSVLFSSPPPHLFQLCGILIILAGQAVLLKIILPLALGLTNPDAILGQNSCPFTLICQGDGINRKEGNSCRFQTKSI